MSAHPENSDESEPERLPTFTLGDLARDTARRKEEGRRAGRDRVAAPTLDLSQSSRPILFLDVDGVLNTFGHPARVQTTRHEIPTGEFGEFSIPVDCEPGLGARLERLAEHFDVVWCTAWFEDANPLLEALAPGLGPWPVLQWRSHKLSEIFDQTPPERPWVWIDDDGNWERDELPHLELVDDLHLIINTDPATGLSEAVVCEAIEFAQRGRA